MSKDDFEDWLERNLKQTIAVAEMKWRANGRPNYVTLNSSDVAKLN